MYEIYLKKNNVRIIFIIIFFLDDVVSNVF